MTDHDKLVRREAFRFLESLKLRYGETLPRSELQRGFDYEGVRVPLLGPEGIFRPKVLREFPLSITVSPESPGRQRRYQDELDSETGHLRYAYRAGDPKHPDNVELRNCIAAKIELIYFRGVIPGSYRAYWPVRIVDDIPSARMFTVSLDLVVLDDDETGGPPLDEAADVRVYRSAQRWQREHGKIFRAKVLSAYGHVCAMCRLRHDKLLDAAHIIPDSDPRGLPIVPNGISLCKLHHAAFDGNFVGIDPDLILHVRPDVLDEEDGPMLQHGLKDLHERELAKTRIRANRPDPEFLEERFDEFRRAS